MSTSIIGVIFIRIGAGEPHFLEDWALRITSNSVGSLQYLPWNTNTCFAISDGHSYSSSSPLLFTTCLIPVTIWSLQNGKIFCRRTACNCQNPSVDLFCCPECDTRVTSQCLDQNGHKLYRSGDNWTYSCQQCRCLVWK